MKYNFHSTPNVNVSVFDEKQYLCDIKITGLRYSVDVAGKISIDFSTDSPQLGHILAQLAHRQNMSPMSAEYDIYIDRRQLNENDIYKVYVLSSPVLDPVGTNYSVGTYSLVFEYISGTMGLNTRTASLTNGIVNCPACGSILEYDAVQNEYICVNDYCTAKIHIKLSRFISIAMRTPDIVRPILEIQRYGYVDNLFKIYELTPTDFVVSKITSYKQAELICSRITETRGNVMFCDFLRALSIVDYRKGDFWLKDQTIYNSFNDPDGVLYWISELGYRWEGVDTGAGEDTLQVWKSKYGKTIETFMSVSAFWEIFGWMVTGDTEDNVLLLNTLVQANIFAPFPKYGQRAINS